MFIPYFPQKFSWKYLCTTAGVNGKTESVQRVFEAAYTQTVDQPPPAPHTMFTCVVVGGDFESQSFCTLRLVPSYSHMEMDSLAERLSDAYSGKYAM